MNNTPNVREPHNLGSFSYKVTNKKIRDVLANRALLDNTVQVAMPFIKATTTLEHEEYLGEGNLGFTLGLHAINQDVAYESIYSSTENEGMSYPLVGYTYQADGTNKRIYATPPNTELLKFNALFDQGFSLETTPDAKFVRMPPPGITRLSVGRNKNGLLAIGQLDISVPTLSQLEFLHRTFLIPGVGMILEWGNQYSPGSGIDPSTLNEHMFPWYDRTKLNTMLERLARREVGLEEILEDYVYKTDGQYMWMFGRVANFSTKANADGSFDCSVKIVGPSEDAWAYSTRVTVVPPSDDSGKICLNETNSIESYFRDTIVGALNLKTILDKVINKQILKNSGWENHVIKISNGNKKEGEKTASDTANSPNISEMGFADDDDAYFMTWRFFVNVILNHPEYGVRKIFNDVLQTDQQLKVNFLRPYDITSPNTTTGVFPVNEATALDKVGSAGDNYINDPLESYVGMNQYLRSVDPSTLLIVNKIAANLALVNDLRDKYKNIIDESKGKLLGDEAKKSFETIGDVIRPPLQAETADYALLTTGVWVNHRAVVEAMLSGDTLLRGVSNLLDRMNQATANYWALALDPVEPEPGTKESYSYTVVDLNYRQNSQAAEKLLKEIYRFNNYVRRTPDGKLIGSETIDCTVDLSLPKRLFSQIATMGLIQPNDLEKASGTFEYTPATKCKHGLISDANDTLRELFAITSISVKGKGKSPDKTYLQKTTTPATKTCSNPTLATTTAQTSGQGAPSRVKQVIEDLVDGTRRLFGETIAERDARKLKSAQVNLDALNQIIKEGGGCPSPTSTLDTQLQNAGVNKTDVLNQNYTDPQRKALVEAGCVNGNLPQSLLTEVGGKLFLKDTATALEDLRARYAAQFGKELAPNSGRTGYRSLADQIEIFRSRKSGEIVAEPLRSKHTWGLAVDLPRTDATWLQRNAGPNWKVTIEEVNNATHLEYIGPISKETLDDATEACGTTRSQILTDSPQTNTTEQLNSSYESVGKKFFEYQQQLSRDIDLGGLEYAYFTTPSVEQLRKAGQDTCNAVALLQQETSQRAQQAKDSQQFTDAAARIKRNFNALNIVFEYVELNPEKMVAEIRCDADGNKSNAFGASPGALSLSADLILPGINGLRVGELFWIDRVPTFYKAFGAFQILSIEDVITVDGWQTQIHSRFNYLGNAWKTSVIELLNAKEDPWSEITSPVT